MSNENKPLSAVHLNTGHGAIGAFAGYHYQWFYFILRMLKMQERGESVDFELRDDVSADVDGHLTFYQLKHTVSKNKSGYANLTVCDPELWKAICVWLDIISRYVNEGTSFNEVFAQADFRLVANKKTNDNDFCNIVEKYKVGLSSIEDVKTLMFKIRDKLKDPEQKDGEAPKVNKVKEYIETAKESEYLPDLLRCIEFDFLSDDDMLNDIRFQIKHRLVQDEFVDAAMHSVIGKVERVLYPIVQEGKLVKMTIEEFDQQILSEVAQYRGRKFIPKYIAPLSFREDMAEQTFIKQLLAVKDLDRGDINQIVMITQQTLDFVESERAAYANHSLPLEDIDALYKNAYAFWNNKFRSCYRGINKDSEEEICKAAANLLDDIRSKSDLKIGEDNLGDYLSNGLFYRMSDTSSSNERTIGWHYNWKKLFNSETNG